MPFHSRRFPLPLDRGTSLPQGCHRQHRLPVLVRLLPSLPLGALADLLLLFRRSGLAIALALTTYFRLENRRRDRKEGGRPLKNTVIEDVLTKFDRATGSFSFLFSVVIPVELTYSLPVGFRYVV
jgi:hypothetical protein